MKFTIKQFNEKFPTSDACLDYLWQIHFADKPCEKCGLLEGFHKLPKRLAYELRESYEDLKFATTRLEHVLDPKYKGKVWFPIDEDGDDPDEPLKPVTLTRLPQADN